jgi:acetyl esterase/lipase
MKLLAYLFVFAFLPCLAQQKNIPRDTSYTLHSTLIKIRKSHPDIEISAAYPIHNGGVTEQKDIPYAEVSGRDLRADLFFKTHPATALRPGILMVHGGGWRTGDKSLMTPMAQQFANAEYFVMAPEYRLSTEATYPAALNDVYTALEWMYENAATYRLDTAKLVIFGCSAGGQLAALAGTTFHKRNSTHMPVAAIVDVDGILAFKHPDSKEGTMAAQWLGGTYEEVPHRWIEASPLTHADETTPPTLFLGSMHPRFLAGRQDFIRILDSYGVMSRTRIFDDAPHSFWLLNPWFERTVSEVLDFLEEVLANKK